MTFKINDYVMITPSPDMKWDVWLASEEIYNSFCGKIGFIKDIFPDNNGNDMFFNVVVNFKNPTFNDPGDYYALFKSDHLIKSSKFEFDRANHYEKAAEDLNIWEQTVKDKRDEIFRYICSEQKDKETGYSLEELEQTNWDYPTGQDFDWEEKTPILYNDDPYI